MPDPSGLQQRGAQHQEGGADLEGAVTGPVGEGDSKALKLSDVSKLLGVPSRQIQYLRERGIVTPSHGGHGRGRASRYTSEDVRQLRFILGLKGLDESLIQQISREVDWADDEYVHHISEAVRVVVDLTEYRE
jgi:hypothetical protein